MHFYHGQETLTIFEWILRAVITFLVIVISAKFMGQRAISQLGLLDFVIALMLGNIIAHPLSDPTIGMKGSVVTTIVIVVLYISGVLLSLKWAGFRSFINPNPIPLIKEGEILYHGLKKGRISIDFLLAELRKKKVEDVSKVALAFLESDGSISLFLDPKYEAVTPSSYQMPVTSFELPRVVIKDGIIDYSELKNINKEERWLKNMIVSHHKTELSNVLLATIDSQQNLKIWLYKNN